MSEDGLDQHGSARFLAARLGEWLQALQIEVEGAGAAIEPPPKEIGLLRLAEEFTALRHEVKLQTRSGRQVLETIEERFAELRQAADLFKNNLKRGVDPKSFLEGFCELDESVDRVAREVERVRRRMEGVEHATLRTALGQAFARQSWWRRWAAAPVQTAVEQALDRHAESQRPLWAALAAGFDLFHARLRRVMERENLRAVECIGRMVDSETMIVVEAVDGSVEPAGFVLTEVRRGYEWNGKTFRCAEVRVSRGPTASI